MTLTFQHVEVLYYNSLNLQRFVWGKMKVFAHNDVFHDEIHVIATYMLNQKTTILILGSFVFFPLQIPSLFWHLKPLILTI